MTLHGRELETDMATETAVPAGEILGKSEPTTGLITPADLAVEIGTDEGRAERVLQVAILMVDEYAPAAPAVLRREAIIRFAGYLAGSDYGGIASESIGPKQVQYQTNNAAAFRNSGAAMLLTRYRRRRAGAIG